MRSTLMSILSMGALLAAGCSRPPSTPAGSPRPAAATPGGFAVQAKGGTDNKTHDFTAKSAYAVVNQAGTECTFWFYDGDRTCQNAEKPDDLAAPWTGIKCAIESDKPIASGLQKSSKTWIMFRNKEDKRRAAAFMGDAAKVVLDSVSLDDGGLVSGKIDLADGESYVRAASFTARVCREK